MEFKIPKIAINTLTEKELTLYKELDKTPYGIELAQQVINKLISNPGEDNGLYFFHRDYCGLGIFYVNKEFLLADVSDGWGINKTIALSSSQTDFVDWLSQENDQSMSLYGEQFNNQTITRIRLEWYLEDDFSHTNNAFCLYLEKRNGRN